MTDKVQLIKEEIESYKESMKGLEPHSDFRRGQITAYNQIMQFIDSIPEEPANEDLDKLVISLEETIGTSPHSREVIKEYMQKAAEWQKDKDKQLVGATQKISHQHGYDEGRFDMREEMMKDAVDGTVKYEIGSAEIPQCDRRYQVLSDQVHIPNAKLGDKVRIIIVKTE